MKLPFGRKFVTFFQASYANPVSGRHSRYPESPEKEAHIRIKIWVFPKYNGTPKSSILIGFSIINHPFWGTLIFGNTHMYIIFPWICCRNQLKNVTIPFKHSWLGLWRRCWWRNTCVVIPFDGSEIRRVWVDLYVRIYIYLYIYIYMHAPST